MQNRNVRELLLDICPLLTIGGAAVLDITQVYKSVEFFRTFLNLLGDLYDHLLNKGRPADSFLHTQLAALHSARQFNLALPSQQRNSAHLAEVYSYRIIRVDGFLRLLTSREFLSVVHFLRVEERSLLVERKTQRLMAVR